MELLKKENIKILKSIKFPTYMSLIYIFISKNKEVMPFQRQSGFLVSPRYYMGDMGDKLTTKKTH